MKQAPATPAEPDVRPEDVPLHEDVRWLAASLGNVIRRLEGEAAFETVESLRQACRARRRGEAGAPSLDALLARVDALPLERAAVTARAFTLFFLLINTAEQVHRVRRSRAYRSVEDAEPQNASARWAMRELRSRGHDAAAVARAMSALAVRPVLTAHPTESTRRTLLALQARVADLLLARDGAPHGERRAIEESLDGEVELLWITGGDVALLELLELEYASAVDAVLRIRDSAALLRDNDVLQSAIALRNPYVDPLSLLQITLLRRKEATDEADSSREALDAVLATTVSGIAQGLRNTG